MVEAEEAMEVKSWQQRGRGRCSRAAPLERACVVE